MILCFYEVREPALVKRFLQNLPFFLTIQFLLNGTRAKKRIAKKAEKMRPQG